ncbi:MAG: DinB family protein [bacterium]|nr:DinB family protein [bacterium]
MKSAPARWRPGPLGALVDELERAVLHLDSLLEALDEEALARPRTLPGAAGLTLREVLEHVLYSGHVYDDLLRTAFGAAAPPDPPARDLPGQDLTALRRRLRALPTGTWSLLADKADWSEEEIAALRIRAGWGVDYDLEQLLEHAVVHVWRHARQVERLLAADAPAWIEALAAPRAGGVGNVRGEGATEAYFASAEWYDRLYSFKDYAGEAAHLVEVVDERWPEARTLLDVACGTGRHLEHLRGRFACEGLDLSPGQLAEARRHLPDLPLHLGDMRDFRLGRAYDVVCCLFSAIGYMTTLPDLGRACAAMARHVQPGGLLLVEPWLAPETWRPGTVHGLFIDEPELKIARLGTSLVRGRLSVLDLHHLVGTPESTRHFVEHHELLLATRSELRAALEAVGLSAEYDETGLGGRGLWIARKPG